MLCLTAMSWNESVYIFRLYADVKYVMSTLPVMYVCIVGMYYVFEEYITYPRKCLMQCYDFRPVQ